jgi:hypothetical protein
MSLFSAMCGRVMVWSRHSYAAGDQAHRSGGETTGWVLVALFGLVLLLR